MCISMSRVMYLNEDRDTGYIQSFPSGSHAYLSCQKVHIRYALKLKARIVQVRGSCVGETGKTRQLALIPEVPLNPGKRF